MPVIPAIHERSADLLSIFEDLHRHPELGFEESRTAAVVADKLRSWGFDEVHTGIGTTGVVGILHGRGTRGGAGNRRVGVRADMDALPIEEASGVAYTSGNPGRMHACGHDGHTTMLLGAAQYLAASRGFAGTAVFVFQPAEEGLGGARRMLQEGLFERFPCDEIYGMHNQPTGKPGHATLRKGAALAGASFFDIHLRGRGSHAAMPHQARDVLVIGAYLIQQLQSIVSRNVRATDACVVSCTQFHTGSAYNVIPETATITGTIRFFSTDVRDLVQSRMRAICEGLALGHGIAIDVAFHEIFDVLLNDAELSDAYLAAAADVVGAGNVAEEDAPFMGSEDFADMLRRVPGSYLNLGHAGTVPLHNPAFVLDPDILPVGASIYARIIETRLPIDKEPTA